jgi:hypothetical protein
MHFTTSLTLATASISSVATMAVPRPWIHGDARSYRHLTRRDAYPSAVVAAANDHEITPTVTKKTLHLIDGLHHDYKYPNGPGRVHGHDEYLPGPTPHSQDEIDNAAHAGAPLYTPANEDLDAISTSAKTGLQLSYRGASPTEAADEKKHHLHSHEDYLPELGRTYRLYGHDEYLDVSGSEAGETVESTSADAKDILEVKVQRRCVWGHNCRDTCAQGGIVGLIGCTWNCGGDANTPTCPKFGHLGA